MNYCVATMHYFHLCSSFILCITVYHGMAYMYTVYGMSYMYTVYVMSYMYYFIG